jgi:hypothetical protein
MSFSHYVLYSKKLNCYFQNRIIFMYMCFRKLCNAQMHCKCDYLHNINILRPYTLLIFSFFVLFRPVFSYPVLHYPVPFLSCFVLSFLILSCIILSCLIISCLILSFPVLSCPFLPSFFPSHFFLSDPVIFGFYYSPFVVLMSYSESRPRLSLVLNACQ